MERERWLNKMIRFDKQHFHELRFTGRTWRGQKGNRCWRCGKPLPYSESVIEVTTHPPERTTETWVFCSGCTTAYKAVRQGRLLRFNEWTDHNEDRLDALVRAGFASPELRQKHKQAMYLVRFGCAQQGHANRILGMDFAAAEDRVVAWYSTHAQDAALYAMGGFELHGTATGRFTAHKREESDMARGYYVILDMGDNKTPHCEEAAELYLNKLEMPMRVVGTNHPSPNLEPGNHVYGKELDKLDPPLRMIEVKTRTGSNFKIVREEHSWRDEGELNRLTVLRKRAISQIQELEDEAQVLLSKLNEIRLRPERPDEAEYRGLDKKPTCSHVGCRITASFRIALEVGNGNTRYACTKHAPTMTGYGFTCTRL